MLIPEFTENRDDGVAMYFPLDGKNPASLYDELEKTYPCFTKMNTVKKDGRSYVRLETAFELF